MDRYVIFVSISDRGFEKVIDPFSSMEGVVRVSWDDDFMERAVATVRWKRKKKHSLMVKMTLNPRDAIVAFNASRDGSSVVVVEPLGRDTGQHYLKEVLSFKKGRLVPPPEPN